MTRSTVPPFPVSGDAHTDILMRELYARLRGTEQVLGIGSGDDAPETEEVVFSIIRGTPVKLLQGFVNYDEGWFRDEPFELPASGPAIVLGSPEPPFVVLQVIVTIDVVFAASVDDPIWADTFGVGTSAAVPDIHAPTYYARGAWRPDLATAYRGWEYPMSYVQPRFDPLPNFKSVGVVQTQRRPILAGFLQEASRFPVMEWPDGMRGRVHVMVLYADTPDPVAVSLSELAQHSLVSIIPPSGP